MAAYQDLLNELQWLPLRCFIEELPPQEPPYQQSVHAFLDLWVQEHGFNGNGSGWVEVNLRGEARTIARDVLWKDSTCFEYPAGYPARMSESEASALADRFLDLFG